MTQSSTRTLQDLLDSVPSFVDHLYSNRKGSVLKDAVLRQPTEFVAPEFTTWRDEQRAWREGIAFYDQSFHMTTTYLRGPDAQRLLSSLAVNSFETFGVGRSRHFVCASPDGHLIGDGCTLPSHAIQYTTKEYGLAKTVASLATRVFGDEIRPRVTHERRWFQVYLSAARQLTHGRGNPVAAWLGSLGAFGLRGIGEILGYHADPRRRH